MLLTFDDDRTVGEGACPDCGRKFEQVVAFVLGDGDAYAIYRAQCHDHATSSDAAAWIDIAIGSWDDPTFSDHATFAVRVGKHGAGFVDAPAAIEASAPHYGHKLSRNEASAHPRVADVWRLVDFIVVEDPTVHEYIYNR